MDRKTPSIYEKPLPKRAEVSASAFAFLFSELVQYCQSRVESMSDLEEKLEQCGYGVGLRVIELVGYRDKLAKRETRVVNMLQYISNSLWKHLFNKVADNLERSTEHDDEYMIYEHSPVTNSFVSVPADFGQFNCAAFIAGIIAGALDSTKFNAKVTAHTVPQADGSDRTVFLVKFSPEVV